MRRARRDALARESGAPMAAKFFEGDAESASASGNGEATQAPPPGVPPAGDDGYLSEVKTPARLALDSAFRAQTDLRLGIVENLRRARAENDSRDARVARAFETFDPTVPARNEPEPRNEVAVDEAPFGAVDQAIRDRIDTLRDTTPRPGITLRANSTLIDWENGDEPASGTIELGKLLDFVDNRDVATLTLPAEPALTAAEAERKAQALLDGLSDADEDGHDGRRAAEANGAVDPQKVSDFVEKAVVEQMGPATAPESRLEYGLIPNGADSNSAQAQPPRHLRAAPRANRCHLLPRLQHPPDRVRERLDEDLRRRARGARTRDLPGVRRARGLPRL